MQWKGKSLKVPYVLSNFIIDGKITTWFRCVLHHQCNTQLSSLNIYPSSEIQVCFCHQTERTTTKEKDMAARGRMPETPFRHCSSCPLDSFVVCAFHMCIYFKKRILSRCFCTSKCTYYYIIFIGRRKQSMNLVYPVYRLVKDETLVGKYEWLTSEFHIKNTVGASCWVLSGTMTMTSVLWPCVFVSSHSPVFIHFSFTMAASASSLT